MPLTLTYTSEYGTITDAYHVLKFFTIVSGSSPNCTVSGSAWLNKAAYDGGNLAFVNYTFKFNATEGTPASGKTPASPQPDIFSQSYAALKAINTSNYDVDGNNANQLVDSAGNVLKLNFTSAGSTKY
jgi:hypothetical protein